MRRLSFSLALLLLLASASLAEVPWAFHPSVIGPDGPTAAYVTAIIDSRQVRYVPPLKWQIGKTRFTPENKLEADAFLEAAPSPGDIPWTDARAKLARAFVLSRLVPGGATNVTVLSESLNPLTLFRRGTYEICFSYTRYGQEFSESIFFAEHGKTELQFHFGCLKKDFPDLHAQFIMSLSAFGDL